MGSLHHPTVVSMKNRVTVFRRGSHSLVLGHISRLAAHSTRERDAAHAWGSITRRLTHRSRLRTSLSGCRTPSIARFLRNLAVSKGLGPRIVPSTPSNRVFSRRLSKPFSLRLNALGHPGSGGWVSMCNFHLGITQDLHPEIPHEGNRSDVCRRGVTRCASSRGGHLPLPRKTRGPSLALAT